jgi:hypothetical protein
MGRLRHRRRAPCEAGRQLASMRGWRALKAFWCNKNDAFSTPASVVPINNKASNTYPHPTTCFSALGPHSEHWPRALLTLKPPLTVQTTRLVHVQKKFKFTKKSLRHQVQNHCYITHEITMTFQLSVPTFSEIPYLVNFFFGSSQ